MTFWDVGAHIGEFSLLASRCVGLTGRVHAFEPQPKIFELLQRNIIANGLTNIAAHSLAVSDQEGFAELSLDPEPSMSFLEPAGFVNEAFPSVSVSTTSLDEFGMSSKQIPDLVKVDVEGAERLVLAGSESLLQLPSQVAPAWIMEFESANCVRFGYPVENLLMLFSDHGFNTYWIREDGTLQPTSGITIQSDVRNIFALKRSLECC
jgi:FkbM family methyltransferase